MRMAKRWGWWIMAIAALCVASYAVMVLTAAPLRPRFVSGLLARTPLAAMLHFACGAIAIVGGALQFNATLRQRHLSFHRWLGRAYVVAVLTAALAALGLATNSYGGIPTHLGFGMLASLWIATTLLAYYHVRGRRIALHRAWMIRSYALTLAAVTLRIYIPVSQMAGLSFEASYIAISWLCWVPNLVIADWWILAHGTREPRTTPILETPAL
jgi:uncharacterized membrane protein